MGNKTGDVLGWRPSWGSRSRDAPDPGVLLVQGCSGSRMLPIQGCSWFRDAPDPGCCSPGDALGPGLLPAEQLREAAPGRGRRRGPAPFPASQPQNGSRERLGPTRPPPAAPNRANPEPQQPRAPQPEPCGAGRDVTAISTAESGGAEPCRAVPGPWPACSRARSSSSRSSGEEPSKPWPRRAPRASSWPASPPASRCPGKGSGNPPPRLSTAAGLCPKSLLVTLLLPPLRGSLRGWGPKGPPCAGLGDPSPG